MSFTTRSSLSQNTLRDWVEHGWFAVCSQPNDCPEAPRLLLCAPAFGIHRSWRQRLGESVFEEWKCRGVMSYRMRANRPIELPYQFWIECRDAMPAEFFIPQRSFMDGETLCRSKVA